MNRILVISAASLALVAGAASADNHPAETVRTEATERGTLHPGHVAVFAAGKYNKPATEFHLVEPGYEAGPGGWADTKKNERAE